MTDDPKASAYAIECCLVAVQYALEPSSLRNKIPGNDRQKDFTGFISRWVMKREEGFTDKKVIILGEFGVGKTRLMLRFTVRLSKVEFWRFPHRKNNFSRKGSKELTLVTALSNLMVSVTSCSFTILVELKSAWRLLRTTITEHKESFSPSALTILQAWRSSKSGFDSATIKFPKKSRGFWSERRRMLNARWYPKI